MLLPKKERSKPSQAAPQDATAPGSMYRSNPSSPAAKGNEPGSFQALAVKGLRKALPINAAMLIQDVAGNKLPLTERDLKNEEINELRYASRGGERVARMMGTVRADGRFPISESDYRFDYGEGGIREKMRDPSKRMATTVGGATGHAPENGKTRVTDSFDFNSKGDDWDFSVKDLMDRKSPYSKLRYLSTYIASKEGQGIPVNINLGNMKRPRPGEKLAQGGVLPSDDYEAWKASLPENHRRSIDPKTGNGYDYDYRAAYKEGVKPDANGHFTDRYKMPNHRTFSNESMHYNEKTKDQGGQWTGLPGVGARWTPNNEAVKAPFYEDKSGNSMPRLWEKPHTVQAADATATKATKFNGLPATPYMSKKETADVSRANNAHVDKGYRDGLTVAGLMGGVGIAGRALRGADAAFDAYDAVQETATATKGTGVLSTGLNVLAAGAGAIKHKPIARFMSLLSDAAGQIDVSELNKPKPAKQWGQPRIAGHAKGGLLPGKLTMLGPDGKAQMELGGGNRIFSRANTRELVSRSLSAKTPAELKELGGRIVAMLDKQDRNKPEYVKD